MREPWTLQVASDVLRDGLGLELVNGSGQVAAEVFRCDADHTVVVGVFEKLVPDDILKELIDLARIELAEFEDGTPLPKEFRFEQAV